MKKALTLIETMVVVGIFLFLFSAILTFLVASDKALRVGRNKMIEQQQARIALDEITRLLKCSNAYWDANHTLSMSENSSRIDFYVPYFYPDCCPHCNGSATCTDEQAQVHVIGDIQKMVKVIFKKNPVNPQQLLKKEGLNPEKIVAQNISALSFTWADSAQTSVDINITTQVQGPYALHSRVFLRNKNITSPSDVIVEEPEEGEF